MKEAKRRREWGAGKNPLKLAAMPWPVFPRHSVSNVLGSLLDEVIRIDKENLGIFSVPVPRDQFPEYYELIKKPMDYGKTSSSIIFPPVCGFTTHIASLLRNNEREACERRISFRASHAERLCSGEHELPSVQCTGL